MFTGGQVPFLPKRALPAVVPQSRDVGGDPPAKAVALATASRLAQFQPEADRPAEASAIEICLNSRIFGDWRNWLARTVRDREVAGSNPVSPTSRILDEKFILSEVEGNPVSPTSRILDEKFILSEVEGNPVSPTKIINN